MTTPASRPTPATQALTLATAPPGQRLRVVATDGPIAAELAREGILPGTLLTVVSRTPLGGPMVVQASGTRLAISADVASRVRLGLPE